VAVKRMVTDHKMKFEEIESASQLELALLSRLHHKHLRLVGYCEDGDDRLLLS